MDCGLIVSTMLKKLDTGTLVWNETPHTPVTLRDRQKARPAQNKQGFTVGLQLLARGKTGR